MFQVTYFYFTDVKFLYTNWFSKKIKFNGHQGEPVGIFMFHVTL